MLALWLILKTVSFARRRNSLVALETDHFHFILLVILHRTHFAVFTVTFVTNETQVFQYLPKQTQVSKQAPLFASRRDSLYLSSNTAVFFLVARSNRILRKSLVFNSAYYLERLNNKTNKYLYLRNTAETALK